MGPRNLLILFFSTVAVSLVILIIFFSLFFKNVDLNFNTRLPESAPDIGRQYNTGPGMNPESKADGLMRSTVNVPPEFKEPEPSASGGPGGAPKEEEEPSEHDLPPISDDVLLDNDLALPAAQKDATTDSEKPTTTEKQSTTRTDRRPSSPPPSSPAPAAPAPRPRPQRVETPPAQPVLPAEPAPAPSGPPVPGQ